MADSKSDILMQLQLAGDSKPLEAECQTEVDLDWDSFADGFTPGRFFEALDFSFGFEIDEDDQKDEKDDQQEKLHKRLAELEKASGKASESKSLSKAFSRWKSASPEVLRNMKRYPVRMDECKITRIYDRASPVLFQAACDSASFSTATLLKRKDVGDDRLQTFLRMEFSDVLITRIDWDNADVIKESFSFVFRKVVVRYKNTSYDSNTQQLLLNELESVNWSYEMDLQNQKKGL